MMSPRPPSIRLDRDATVDLGEEREVRRVVARFLQSVPVGIFRPDRVEVSLSTDGREIRPAAASDATLSMGCW